MTNEMGTTPPAEAPQDANRQRNLIIIVLVVLLVLCCCCALIAAGSWVYVNRETLFKGLSQSSRLLPLILAG